ncbi:type II toxin-antitoxin system VapC family toxin [Nonomuraea rhizosphaerae]|uniref:type II toxin-antitoxin system VapC family toxin n=1 Tax=Nonomuraea rhizosphaerae TaxID=2665663 RepID=UPI001C5EC22E|nr:PIN domain-containing protein [Nonomuraea rhizosphaerae]
MIVIDSGPLIAAVNRQDNHHETCASFLQTHPGLLLVPATVVAEVCQLIETRQGGKALAAFLRSFQSGLVLIDIIQPDLDRMSDLVEAHASIPLGAVDASLIAVTERLGVTEIATLDRQHFTLVRPRHVEAFTLLPEI